MTILTTEFQTLLVCNNPAHGNVFKKQTGAGRNSTSPPVLCALGMKINLKRKICFSFNCNKIFVGFQKEFFQQQGREHRKPKKQTHKRHSLPSERTEPLPSKLRERKFPFSTASGNHILIEAVLSLKSTLFYPEKLLINISQDWDTFLFHFKARHTAPRKRSNTNHMNALW